MKENGEEKEANEIEFTEQKSAPKNKNAVDYKF